jgi:UDP-N-acetylglucosamine 3-dehydrogenase
MIKVAVIGVGSMGKNHARVYYELSNVKLVAVSDLDSSNLREISSKFSCKGYRDYKEMLREVDIDAVSIAVPTKLHKELTLNSIAEGKHILVEKPIADTKENALKMIGAAKRKGVVLAIGHVERYNPGVTKLKEIIEEGKLGEITSIMARRVGGFPPQIKDANVILDLAVHDIDIINYLLEARPKEVYAKSGDALKSGREDHAIINLVYEDVACVVQVNWITPVKVRELLVTGTKGYAELNYITQELRVFESSYEKSYDSFGDFVVKFGSPKEVEVKVHKKEPLKAELESFIDCIKNNKEPLIKGEDALHSLEISNKAIESYKKGTVIKI